MFSPKKDIYNDTRESHMDLDWHQDCLSLTLILASEFSLKSMKKLLLNAGYEKASQEDSPEALLHSLHVACHQDTGLVDAITKSLNKKYRSSLIKTKGMDPDKLCQEASDLSWPLPLLWSCFQQSAPGMKSQGRLLAHLVLWKAIERFRKQPRLDDQQKRIKELSSQNMSLRNEISRLRDIKKPPSPKVEARRAVARQTQPDYAQREISALKKVIRSHKKRLDSEKQLKQQLKDELAVWRALALNKDSAERTPDKTFSVQEMQSEAIKCAASGMVPCKKRDCRECPLQGAKVAVIGGLERMESNYCQVVNKLGGQCLCHTGSVAGGCRRLRQIVGKSDLVVFITTINSHTAINTVKEECKKLGKPFCAMGRTGASSLEKVLEGMAA